MVLHRNLMVALEKNWGLTVLLEELPDFSYSANSHLSSVHKATLLWIVIEHMIEFSAPSSIYIDISYQVTVKQLWIKLANNWCWICPECNLWLT